MKPFILLIVFSLTLSGGCAQRHQAYVEPASKKPPTTEIIVRPVKAVVSPVVVSPVPALSPAETVWQLRPGLLRAQIEAWAALAGYQVVWDVTRDYSIQNDTLFRGGFVNALTELFTGLQQLGNSFKVIVYQGNRVVFISEE